MGNMDWDKNVKANECDKLEGVCSSVTSRHLLRRRGAPINKKMTSAVHEIVVCPFGLVLSRILIFYGSLAYKLNLDKLNSLAWNSCIFNFEYFRNQLRFWGLLFFFQFFLLDQSLERGTNTNKSWPRSITSEKKVAHLRESPPAYCQSPNIATCHPNCSSSGLPKPIIAFAGTRFGNAKFAIQSF